MSTVTGILQFLGTVLLALTFAADVLTLIYLTGRDGWVRVMQQAPKFALPQGQYAQALYAVAALILIWEFVGTLFGLATPNSLLTFLVVFVILSAIFISLKQYDDQKTDELNVQETLLIIAMPVLPNLDIETVVSRMHNGVVPEHQPIYTSVITRSVLELRDSLGIDVLRKSATKGDTNVL